MCCTVNAVYSLVDRDKWLHHEYGSPITVSKNQLISRACELCSILRYDFIFAPVSACYTLANSLIAIVYNTNTFAVNNELCLLWDIFVRH